jgi:hypothetical protein
MSRAFNPFAAFDALFHFGSIQDSTSVAAQDSTPVATTIAASIAAKGVSAGQKERRVRDREPRGREHSGGPDHKVLMPHEFSAPVTPRLPPTLLFLGAMQSPSQGAMQGHFQGAMKGHFQGANHQPKNVQQSIAPRREVRKIIERIESLVATHHFSEEIAKLVMRLLAILKIGCNSEDDSILRVVHMIVSIVCIGYHKISKIFATMSVSELSFHELMMMFGHSHYTDGLFDDLAIIGISEEDTKSLSCSTIADPTKCFFYNFAGRIVPSQDEVREILRKRLQPVSGESSTVCVEPSIEQKQIHQAFLDALY